MTFQKLITFIMIGLTCGLLAACQNTVQGFGKDLQHSGQAIQKSMDDGK